MGTANDDFIVGLVKGKIGEVLDRMDRERPELSQQDRDTAAIRLGRQEIAQALASRPDLAERFGEMAAEHFLRGVAIEVRSLRSQ
jgi:hypothetical protein